MSKQLESRIREAANERIVELIGERVELRQRGRNWLGLCPFHDDHSPSLSVNPQKRVYKCFSCGKGGDAVDFLLESGAFKGYRETMEYLAKRLGVYSSELAGMDVTPAPVVQCKPSSLETLLLPAGLPAKYVGNYELNPLAAWLKALPWQATEAASVDWWLRQYLVGTSAKGETLGWTIWWQIDVDGNVRDGKAMKYLSNGHRCKEGYCVNNIGAMLEKAGKLNRKGTQTRHCLFGLHLLNCVEDIGAITEAWIVESEKSAVIAAIDGCISSPQRLWLATGGKGNLNAEALKPLEERGLRITLVPDVDAYDSWCAFAKAQKGVRVSDIVKRHVEELGQHGDIADLITLRMNEQRQGIQTADGVKGVGGPGLQDEMQCDVAMQPVRTSDDEARSASHQTSGAREERG
ncbi:MAG: DUF6371 domain-containing protein [Prevotellaceae bacterium]|nr:DUF6371 domain-containing protein [Prevotellaceae bacterium]